MRRSVRFFHPCRGDEGILRRGGQFRVAQQLLNYDQGRGGVEHVRSNMAWRSMCASPRPPRTVYNFTKIHRTLRLSPGMAEVTDRLWDV